MKLSIGLRSENYGWERILKQEGCSHFYLSLPQLNDFPIIIIPALKDKQDKEAILEHVSDGKVAILEPRAYREMFKARFKKRKVKYLVPEENSCLQHLGLTDIFCEFYELKSENINYLDRTFKISIESYGNGYIILLPFDLNSVLMNSDSKRKRFYAEGNELPSELVSKVSKGKIRQLVVRILKYAHDLIDIPFVRRWYYPADYKNAFLFRLDTDYCSKEDAMTVYKLCSDYQIKATWFLDTVSPERLKEVYAGFELQEIGLHCFRHKVFPDYQSNYDNLKLGLDELNKVGIHSHGFAAPFGSWNINLAKAIEDLGFDYSSEFSLDYDDLPFYPIFDNDYSPVLQIPIHPISIGRLLRSHYSEKEMKAYYKMVLANEFSLHQPALFYYHPHRQKNEVIEYIFSLIDKDSTWQPSFIEYAKWWQQRWKKTHTIRLEDGKLFCENKDDEDYFLISENGKETLTKLNKAKRLAELDWEEFPKGISKERMQMRRFHWRDLLYNFESMKGRMQQ